MSRAIPMPTANAYRVERRGAWIYYGPQLNARWMSLYTVELLIRKAIASPDETAAWHPDRAQRPIIVPLGILEDASTEIREADRPPSSTSSTPTRPPHEHRPAPTPA